MNKTRTNYFKNTIQSNKMQLNQSKCNEIE